MRLGTLATLLLVALAAALAPAAHGDFQPLELRVDDGEQTWHPERSFALRWSNPAHVAAVHYRLLNPLGQVVIGETTLGWPATSIQQLAVPPTPGAYTAEVWLEGESGEKGAPVTATLRFDDTAPGHIEPLAVAAWIGRTAFPYTLHLAHPVGTEPLSGIRGYAVSIDDGTTVAEPCADPYTCDETETDLHSGVGGDALTVPELPEGTNRIRAVAVSGSGVHSASSGSVLLHVDKTDPVTQLSGLEPGWSNQPLKLTAISTDAASGVAAAGAGGPFTAVRVDGGAPVVAPGDTVTTTVIASGTHTVTYYARDAAGNAADGGTVNGKQNRAPASAVVRIDREPPHLAFTNAQDPREPERIEARASDSLSGLNRSRSAIAVRRVGSGERFTELPTAIVGDALWARWDSETYPAAEYEFRATIYDVAGNSASTLNRNNGLSMRLRSPIKVATTLLTGFGGPLLIWHRCVRNGDRRRCHEERVRDFARRPALRTVPYGRGMLFSGRLVAGRGTPLTGTPVQVIEHFEGGADPQRRVSTVKTGADGGFNLRLGPGPSREITATATPTASLRGASSKPLRLEVRSGIRMRASSAVARVGGGPVVFRGEMAATGAAIPAEGKIVQLQFRLPGLPWSEFRTLRTDPRGHFRYAYRFSDDDSRGIRFQFRAVAPEQSGWPFASGYSRTLMIRGR